MRLFVVAGEASGDTLVSELIAELRRRRDVTACGLVGPLARAAGVEPVGRSEDVQAMGLVEVVPRIPEMMLRIRRLARAARAFRPDVLLTVDSPALTLRVARRLRGVTRRVHWVSPQFWAWRPGRLASLRDAVDDVLCLLPFEAPLLRAAGVRAHFVGHPGAIAARARRDRALVALAPGSRPTEVRRLWPVLRDVAARLRAADPGIRFVVPVAPTVPAPRGLDALYVPSLVDARRASVAVTASGTATLEWAALGVPQVVTYAMHPVTWALGRRMVRVPGVALPNVLLGAPVVPEHLQNLCPQAIANTALALRGAAGEQQVQALAPALASLQGGAAIARTADAVLA